MQKKLRCVFFGDIYDSKKFIAIKNGDCNKPSIGGLWLSPITSEYGWEDFCREENFPIKENKQLFDIQGNILVIETEDDIDKLPWITGIVPILDHEKLAQQYDGIWVKLNAIRCRRRLLEHSFAGWDVETVLIYNPSILKSATA